MANSLGALVVSLGLDAAGFVSGLTKAEYQSKQFAQNLEKSIARARAEIGHLGKELLTAFGIGFGVHELFRAFETVIEKAIEEERALSLLNATLKATGFAAGLTAEQLEKLGSGIQGKTIFDDDEIRKAATALLRFRDVQGEVFAQALKLAPDVATALGIDLAGAAVALGKALTDPEHGMKALKAAGLSLSDQQKDLAARMVETGDKAGAQKIVMDELTGSIGGLAESDNKGAYGATRRLTRAWGDMEKALGRPIASEDNVKRIDSITEAIERFIRAGQKPFVSNFDTIKRALEIAGLKDETFALPKPETQEDQSLKNAQEREAELGRLRADAEKERDAEYNKQQARLKAQEANASSFFGRQLAIQKAGLDAQQAASEFAYARGTVTVEDFYATQKKLAEEANAAVERSIDQQAFAALRLKESPKTNLQEKEALQLKADAFAAQVDANKITLAAKLDDLTRKQIVDIERLGDEYGQLAEQIALSGGNAAAAASIAFERSNREFTRRLTARGDTGALADLAGQRQQAVTLGSLADATRKYTLTVEDLGAAQASVSIQEQTGLVSEIDLLNKKAAIAKEYIPILKQEIEAQEKIIATLQDGTVAKDDALRKLAQERLLLEQLAATSDGLRNKFSNIFSDNFTTALDAIVNRTKSVKDAFKDMARSIASDIAHLANQQIAKRLADSLFVGGTSGGNGVDLIGKFIGLFAGGIGGGSPSWPTGAGGIPEFATGTGFAPGGWAKVHKDEIINLPRGSQVIPANDARNMGGGLTIITNVLPGASRATADQSALMNMREAKRAGRYA